MGDRPAIARAWRGTPEEQAGAILLSDSMAEGVPVATRMNDVRFRKMVHPGDEILMEVQLIERLANAFFMQGKATRDGKTVMRFEFACTLAPPSEQGIDESPDGK